MKLAIAGASGKMGQMLIEAALTQPDLQVAVALDRMDSPMLGRDCAETLGRTTGVRVLTDLAAVAAADVLIDFTRPEATLKHVEACVAAGVRMVIGTTGFEEAGSARSPAPSASRSCSPEHERRRQRDLQAGGDCDTHAERRLRHRNHRSTPSAQGRRPSGTALKMGEIAPARWDDHRRTRGVRARRTHRRAPPGSIGFAATRGGDIIGDHTVMFAGAGERIEIPRSASRQSYANGSLRAARFVAEKPKGLFDMFDVLGLAR
jgi:4-hydroxy-tetrahydrodipicolinate reductase